MGQSRLLSRNIVSAVCLVGLFFYITYFTSELYTRLDNIKKYERLQQYGQEVRLLFQTKKEK